MNKILLVDDSVDLLQVLKIFLEMEHFVVKTLTHPYCTYKEICEFKPDLLILDIFLEKQDSREVCKNLRQHPAANDLRILLTSTSPATLAEYKTYLADDYLEKPFDLWVLNQKIQSLLELAAV